MMIGSATRSGSMLRDREMNVRKRNGNLVTARVKQQNRRVRQRNRAQVGAVMQQGGKVT